MCLIEQSHIITLSFPCVRHYRWIQGFLHAAAAELLPQCVHHPTLVVHGQYVSVAVRAVGDQHAPSLPTGPQSHLQALQSQQTMSQAASSPPAHWEVSAAPKEKLHLFPFSANTSVVVVCLRGIWVSLVKGGQVMEPTNCFAKYRPPSSRLFSRALALFYAELIQLIKPTALSGS